MIFFVIDLILWTYMIYLSYRAFRAYKNDYSESEFKMNNKEVANPDTVEALAVKDINIDGIFNSDYFKE